MKRKLRREGGSEGGYMARREWRRERASETRRPWRSTLNLVRSGRRLQGRNSERKKGVERAKGEGCVVVCHASHLSSSFPSLSSPSCLTLRGRVEPQGFLCCFSTPFPLPPPRQPPRPGKFPGEGRRQPCVEEEKGRKGKENMTV